MLYELAKKEKQQYRKQRRAFSLSNATITKTLKTSFPQRPQGFSWL